jgi:lauroyl/myristoyl acyltransferase
MTQLTRENLHERAGVEGREYVEEIIRENPDQWFRIRQRWKTKRCQA